MRPGAMELPQGALPVSLVAGGFPPAPLCPPAQLLVSSLRRRTQEENSAGDLSSAQQASAQEAPAISATKSSASRRPVQEATMAAKLSRSSSRGNAALEAPARSGRMAERMDEGGLLEQ